MLSRIGVDIIDVSHRLGHANTRITQETYEYLFRSVDTDIAEKLENFYENVGTPKNKALEPSDSKTYRVRNEGLEPPRIITRT